MKRAARRLGLLLLAACLCGVAPGCFGVSQNPSYFPYLLPFGDVIQTHAKPPGHGYYANFDPHAVRLVVERLESTSQVGTQHVLLATVYDQKNVPRRNRRIEWMAEGSGNIVEVDESGHFPGRGYKATDKYAVSYTSWGEHRVSRGNGNTADDFVVRPGQSWCVLSSPVEGDTHVTVYAPGIYDWDRRVVRATIHWVDATWDFPMPATAKFGTPHVFTTKIFRFTDRRPLAGYRVRYTIVDGPPATFVPSGTQEFTAVSDLSGNAQVTIAQTAGAAGTNKIAVEIIRPPDPTTPSGAGLPIVRGETSVRWLAPSVTLSHTAPATAPLGNDVTFTTTATNAGDVDSEYMTITLPIPEGLEYVSSQPQAAKQAGQLVYTFGKLAPGQSHTVQTTFRSRRAGPITSMAQLQTAEGQTDRKEATVTIAQPGLDVSIDAPATGVVGVPVTFKVRVTNPGSGALGPVALSASFDAGLEHDQKVQALNSAIKEGLPPGGLGEITLILTPKLPGRHTLTVKASSGALDKQAAHTITVQQPKLTLSVEGPQRRFVGRPAEYKIRVANPGDVAVGGIVVRDRLPPELEFVAAPQNGTVQNGEVVWNVGTLQPREERTLELKAKPVRVTKAAEQLFTLTSEGGLRSDKKWATEIEGAAGLDLTFTDLDDPVEVGKTAVYRLEVINNGSAPLRGVEVKLTASAELRPSEAQGPSKETIAGQVVTFGKIDNIEPGTKVTFLVKCRADKAGDARMRAEVGSEGRPPPPVLREVSTRIIAPFTGPAPPPPPPPGGGQAVPLPKG